MKKRTGWVLLGAGAIVIAIVIKMAGCNSAIQVDTADIVRATLSAGVSAEGRTRISERFVISTPFAGQLTRVFLNEGDTVAEGDTLAQLFPLPEDSRGIQVNRARLAAAEARQAEALAQVEMAEKNLGQVEREVVRIRVLAEKSAISEQEFERKELEAITVRNQFVASKATLAAAKADAEVARAALMGVDSDEQGSAAVAIRTPMTGKVLRVLQESARVVPAGTPFVELGDIHGLEVVVEVLSEDAVQVEPGAPVIFEEWGGADVLQGRVRLVEPDAFTEISALGVEEQRVNIIVDLFDAPPLLGSGYRVEAKITTWTGDDVLIVPTSALFQGNGAWQVFVIESDLAVRRSIQVGHRSDEAAEVLDGLTEGDQVVVFPSDQIDDGVRVDLRRP